jgi:hypothetical protein
MIIGPPEEEGPVFEKHNREMSPAADLDNFFVRREDEEGRFEHVSCLWEPKLSVGMVPTPNEELVVSREDQVVFGSCGQHSDFKRTSSRVGREREELGNIDVPSGFFEAKAISSSPDVEVTLWSMTTFNLYVTVLAFK